MFSVPAIRRPVVPSNTSRAFHIRRLQDILQLSIQTGDLVRAKRAWCILARCKEVNWRVLWRTGLTLAGSLNESLAERTDGKLEYLRAMMLRHQDSRELILQEIVLLLIDAGQYREALDEINLYLPSFPYQDNPVLHTYAGLLSLFMAQPFQQTPAKAPPRHVADQSPSIPPIITTGFSEAQLRDAQSHLERARSLDEHNVVASGFLDRIRLGMKLAAEIQEREEGDDSDGKDDLVPVSSDEDEELPSSKRMHLS
ncbi:hypothetical protein BOTBODRAFT_591586 [Botryobasidium botryosum FD-172 SS1]|uniref:Uncharacterized protein n=1 Tax=Botryobasidium botryosum (strain FD-172 SS1) TaxID=930990 RepID=A0A067LWP8_BOTB1|nr:hypothetical protein BOTBODRAFT_591586 [Botryobasidium botryosum FD-172 SS1]